MIESILASLISTAIVHIVKGGFAANITDKEVKEDKSQIINQANKFILNNLSNKDLSRLKLFINDTRFQEAFAEYLINDNNIQIIKYSDEYFFSGVIRERNINLITKIKKLFDQTLLQESQNPANKELITFSTEKIIPKKLEKIEDELNFVKEIDEPLFAKLNALLNYNKEIFNEHKIMFGTYGIDKNLIVEIARLEYEIGKLLN